MKKPLRRKKQGRKRKSFVRRKIAKFLKRSKTKSRRVQKAKSKAKGHRKTHVRRLSERIRHRARHRTTRRRRHLRQTFKAVPRPRWITTRQWIKNLRAAYPPFEITQGDQPSRRLRFIETRQKFLHFEPRIPPLAPQTVYILLEVWFVVYDRTAREHTLCVFHKHLGQKVPWKRFFGGYPQMVKRFGRKAADLMNQSGTVILGLPWKGVLAMLPRTVRHFMDILKDTHYREGRAFAGWTVYASPLWAERILKKRRS